METAVAIAQCIQNLHRFYYYLDEFRYQDLVGTMQPDGVWHRQGQLLRGRTAVLDALASRPRTQRVRHVVTNAFVDVLDAGTAQLVAYATAYRHDDGTARQPPPVKIHGPHGMQVVRSRFTRTDAGPWLIAETQGHMEFEF